MNALEAAVDTVARKERDPARRKRCVDLLNGMAADCAQAAKVWGNYAGKAATVTPASPAVFINWTGPELARELFNIHLSCREKWNEFTQGQATLEDEMVVLAYRKLNDGETGPDAARAAVETLNARIGLLKAGAEKLMTATPAAKAKPAPKAKPAVKAKVAPKAKTKKAAPAKARPKVKAKPKAKPKAKAKPAAKKKKR